MKTKPSPLTKLALSAIEDMKAVDVKVLDVMSQTPMTDDMIICTGTSNRHVRSIAENVAREAKKNGHLPQGIEGMAGGEWVLVDLGGVIVHVMQAQARAFYQLEKLWEIEPLPEPATARSRAKLKKSAAKPGQQKGKSAKAKPAKARPVRKAAKPAPRRKPAKSAPKSAMKKATKPAAKKKPLRRAKSRR